MAAMAKVSAAGHRRSKLLNGILINGSLGLICLLWLIPLLGLLVSSFRDRSDIISSGWWTVFPHQEYVNSTQVQLTKGLPLDQPIQVEGATVSDDQLRAMLRACRGPDLRDRRDEAILRLMFTTGARAGEVAAMQVNDLNLRSVPPTVIIRRGKGGKGRVVPLAVETAAAIDKYLRARRLHRLKADPALWLGDRGKHFSYDAMHQSLGMRAQIAGVTGFHPHRLRHTAAHRWLSKGGSEGGLMAVAGWTRPDMLMRYTKAQASARAAEEAQRLNLGEL